MRWSVIALLLIALGCTTTTSVTRTRTGIFAPKNGGGEDEDDSYVPRGISLSIESAAPDGTVILTLRNYSEEPFTFGGTQDAPDLILEVRSGATQSRHTLSHGRGGKATELAAGERVELKTMVIGATGEIRIGIRSHDIGYVVWTPWVSR